MDIFKREVKLTVHGYKALNALRNLLLCMDYDYRVGKSYEDRCSDSILKNRKVVKTVLYVKTTIKRYETLKKASYANPDIWKNVEYGRI